MPYYLGIDGGGTKTRCALADDRTLVARATGGGCNPVRLGLAKSREALQGAIREVCAAAAISPQQLAAVCIGIAGAARPEIANCVRQSIAELTSASIQVVGDMEIALQAAFGAGPGVIAIAGTGSIVYGRDAQGRTTRAGGWGFVISDEGSGQWIGRNAVLAVLRASEEGKKSALTAGVLRAWNLESLDALVPLANSTPPPDFPRLFAIVLQATDEGDVLARSLLEQAGAELAKLAVTVIRRLPHPPPAPVAMTGSVFRQSAIVRQVFYNNLASSVPGAEVRPDLVEPVQGAIALARKMGPR